MLTSLELEILNTLNVWNVLLYYIVLYSFYTFKICCYVLFILLLMLVIFCYIIVLLGYIIKHSWFCWFWFVWICCIILFKILFIFWISFWMLLKFCDGLNILFCYGYGVICVWYCSEFCICSYILLTVLLMLFILVLN